MKRLIAIAILSVSLAGCAGLTKLQNVYEVATTATVPASDVVIAANAFDALKATATNYGNYCVSQNFPRPICSAANRRIVIRSVNSGTKARIALESSISTGTPAVASVYNALIAAVNSLQDSPVNTVKGQ